MIETILQEAVRDGGFMAKIREGKVDKDAFARLLDAIEAIRIANSGKSELDRAIVAALFEVPWEIENCVAHYQAIDPEIGRQVSHMADKLRSAIHELVWDGLDGLFD